MKKIYSLILLVILLASITGCGAKQDQKSEEELKAEIKAEMEAEAKKEEELREQIKAELEAEEREKEEQHQQEEASQETIQDKMVERTVNAADLKEGDTIDGLVIKKLHYIKGDEFAIELDGEFTVTGEIIFDTEYYNDFVLSIDEECALPTTIEFKFDEMYQVRPPLGLFQVKEDNLNILKTKIGTDRIQEIQNGNKLKVELIVDGYGFYAKNYTESFSNLNIKKVINAE